VNQEGYLCSLYIKSAEVYLIQSLSFPTVNREFINVSLADFSLSGKSDEAPLENSEIELSILQQILIIMVLLLTVR
jgi:hypothetical protein